MTTLVIYIVFSYISVYVYFLMNSVKVWKAVLAYIIAPITFPVLVGAVLSKIAQDE